MEPTNTCNINTAFVVGILFFSALSGCSREAWRNFAEGYNEAHERNWKSDEWTAPAQVRGNMVYDSNGHRALILPNGNIAPGPARVQTDVFGNKRLIDSQGRMHLVQ